MPTRAEALYGSLQNASAIKGLINETEDAHLDCKEWPSKDEEAQKMLAKAVCGLANAEGGVLVIGMKAESRPKDEPDVISAPAPVHDVAMVKSRVLNLVGNLVEPGVAGVNAKEVRDGKGAKAGFVVVLVPPSDGPPHRSRKDWKFYQRIGSGTFPMEYFQIEEKFSRRPHPRLKLGRVNTI
jgi:predicted HTH transcriptional regulator